MSIFITTFLTIFTFVVGQIIAQIFIKPIQKQKELVGEINFALFYYANYYYIDDKFGKMNKNQIKELEKAKDEIRKLGSRLKSSTKILPFYNFFSKINFVLKDSKIEEIFSGCIGWSNSIFETVDKKDRLEFRKKIAKALNIN